MITSAILGGFLAFFIWKRRRANSGIELFFLMLSVSWWALFLFFESASTTLSLKVLFAIISFAGIASSPVLFMLFALRFTGSDKWLRKIYVVLLFVIPFITLMFASTNSVHHFLWSDIVLTEGWAGIYPVFSNGPYFWIHISYSYSAILVSLITLYRHIFLYKKIFSIQIRIIFLSALVPLTGSILYVLFPGSTQKVDLTPVSFVIAGALMTFAIFKYHFLDVVPIARDILMENVDDGILFLDKSKRIIDFNRAFVEIFNSADIKAGDNVEKAFNTWPDFLNYCLNTEAALNEIKIHTDIQTHYSIRTVRLQNKNNSTLGFLIIMNNIENLKISEKAIQQSRDLFEDLIDFLPDATFAIDTEGKIIAWNRAMESMVNIKKEDVIGKGNYEYAVPFYGERRPTMIDRILKNDLDIKEYYNNIEARGQNLYTEGFNPKIYNSKGAYLWGIAAPLLDSGGELMGAIQSIRDISSRKKMEEKLQHMSFHDSLTGLYNRAYFEEELKRLDKSRQLPISILIADLNGLKLINDAFGHNRGDELLKLASETIKKCSRNDEIIARWGGDEFTILLANTDAAQAQIVVNRINKECEKTIDFTIPLSIAIGASTKTSVKENIHDILKIAEDQMYRHKLLESKSIQNSIIKSLTRTLQEKNIETEIHSNRVADFSLKLGKLLKLPNDKIDELMLLSKLHDIGKVAVSEDILKKSGKLDESEWEAIKKHSEIGYRIAGASPILYPVADYILHHHEWWNGNGYPKGLKGDKIPLMSRIACIADAYDVMTSERPYKKAMTEKEAMEELKRFAGIQFDPDLVEKFVSLINK